MQATVPTRPVPSRGRPPEPLRAAFHELHASRLHGFALLVTLGDRARSARECAEALAEGAARANDLRHPERAAAWLRRRVVERVRRRPRRIRPSTFDARFVVLRQLGVDIGTFEGLAALDHLERAALVADAIERLDRRDVGVIIGLDGARLDRRIRTARRRFLAAASAVPSAEGGEVGSIVARVRAISARALA